MDNPITTPLPADLPESWTTGQIVAPNGADVGLSEQHGYNYLMQQVNAAQSGVNTLGEALANVPPGPQSITVTATTAWTEQSTLNGTEYWEQTVTIPGLTASDQVDIALDADALNQLVLDGVIALWAENDNGTCILKTLGAAPTAALTLYLTLTNITPAEAFTLSDLSPGALVSLNENGSLVPFYVAKHDYESGLNGPGRTLVVRKDVYDQRQWNTSDMNAWATCSMRSWLNDNYKALLDTNIQNLMGATKYYYTPGNGNNTVTTRSDAVFLLSFRELGEVHVYANIEGSVLPIANTIKIAYQNGIPSSQWTRTPVTNSVGAWRMLATDYAGTSDACTAASGSRPAFTLPGYLLLNETQNPDGSYSPLIG